MLTLILNTALAQEPVRTVGLADSAYGFGAGVVLGEPTGLSFCLRRSERTAFDLAVALNVYNDRNYFNIHGEYLFSLVAIRDETVPNVSFPVYLGVGPRITDNNRFTDLDIGVRVPIGIGVLGETVPVDAFLEIAPVLVLFPYVDLVFEGGLGFRVFFS